MPKKPPPSPAARTAYHHGALRSSLIDATEALLAERGLEGFSLREVARRSGVSPAAPAHHFGDADGLLTVVATLAFDGLTEALAAGNARGGSDPVARLREQGVGYVRFALRHPGRFGLMFRAGNHGDDAELQRSGHAAFAMLENGVRDLLGVPPDQPLTAPQHAVLMSIWSTVHGFAHLTLAGQLHHTRCDLSLEASVDAVVGPMLQQQLEGLQAVMEGTGKQRAR
ncbi:TetR/AcrR family transcriptional regulator [Schlegelella sp. S2-27]|uniref:TetR/AcrR family transcriptional regulator n=1 Tax=Caldimonas mangrovi TaxID=2944811 RepID=A0ABT0YKQ9_9BURK|nr:TetR/AcrR family transcriptional regulator [Caldimonas mangrovi]MCM5678949.1 TetR/AcrR family transcriptional regulator [Caldimonas mangrovi]